MKIIILLLIIFSPLTYATCESQLSSGSEQMSQGMAHYRTADAVLRSSYNYESGLECEKRMDNITEWEAAEYRYKQSEYYFTDAKRECRGNSKKTAIQGIESAKINIQLVQDILKKSRAEIGVICETQRSVDLRKINVCDRGVFADIYVKKTGAYDCSKVILDKITTLNLDGTNLSAIPENAFKGLVNATQISLENTGLDTIPENVFMGLPKLKDIWLSGNKIKILPMNLVAVVPSLENLYLNNNQIRFLPSDFISKNLKLKILRLDNNQIEAIPLKFFNFNNESIASFEGLNLSFNKITTLYPGMFKYITSIKELYLQSNKINALPENLLSNMYRLKEFSVESNNISILPSGFFKETSRLNSINLNFNQLTEIHSEDFGEQFELTGLYLQSNKIGVLPDDLLRNMPNLSTVHLAENNFYVLPENFFGANKALTFISLWGNKLSSISDSVFSATPNLKELYLTENQLTKIPVVALQGLTKLETLTLRKNLITEVPSFAFKTLVSLKTLGLKDNKIATVNKSAFYGLDSLSFLDFGGNVVEITSRDQVGLRSSVKIEGNMCFGVYSVIAQNILPPGQYSLERDYLYLTNPFLITCDELYAPDHARPASFLNKIIKTIPNRVLINDESIYESKYIISRTKDLALKVFNDFQSEGKTMVENREIQAVEIMTITME